MTRNRFPETEGEMQTRLEAALEHFEQVWGKLRLMKLHDFDKANPVPSHMRDYDPGDVRYSLAAAHGYVFEVLQGMARQWGSTDGQLCPYDDCVHDLAVPKAGWYACGHCLKPVYFEVADGIEDYHAYRPEERGDKPPEHLPIARDLGPSWGTPK